MAKNLRGIAPRGNRRELRSVELKQPLYAFDSTIIDLCLFLFPGAEFRTAKAALKLHTLIDLRGSIPTFVAVTSGKVPDVRMLDQMSVGEDAIYAMDRGYVDFARLYAIHLFEKKPIMLLDSEALKQTAEAVYAGNQLNLFGN